MSKPQGFAPIDFSHMPYMQSIGEVFCKQDSGADLHLGVSLKQQHCNSLGVAHGGMLATLADVVMGRALRDRVPSNKAVLTLNMHLDYIGGGKVGDWLDICATIKRSGGTISNCECHIHSGEQLLLSASANFKTITIDRS